MKFRKICFFLLVNFCGLALLNSTMSASAQREGKSKYQLPSDKRLLELHKKFVLEAEKLAKEYKKNNDPEKCRVVCEEILKLVPSYPGAVKLLQEIGQEEREAETVEVEVHADKAWQNTHIMLIPGKPISITAKAGSKWTFKMEYKDLTPEGFEIPKEFRDFKLGALIGFIQTPEMGQAGGPPGKGNRNERNAPRPFHIGNHTEFTARETGILWLRMHDDNPADNEGTIVVQVKGTFERTSRK